MFASVPDSVTCHPGEQKPTGDMRTPWCDDQQALEQGHYISITLSKKWESDHVYQLFQSGCNVHKECINMDYSLCAHIQVDYNITKGEYKLLASQALSSHLINTNQYVLMYFLGSWFFNVISLKL